MNRAERRAMKYTKPQKSRSFIQLPINIRFSPEKETDLMLVPDQALERMRTGCADDGDFNDLALRLNWARLLNKANFENGEQIIADGQAALTSASERNERYGTWSVSTPEHSDIAAALVLANQMQKMCTRRELLQSLEAVDIARRRK